MHKPIWNDHDISEPLPSPQQRLANVHNAQTVLRNKKGIGGPQKAMKTDFPSTTNGQDHRHATLAEPPLDKIQTLTTIVIPVFNEEAALPLVLEALFCCVVDDKTYEVLVVDDGSTDGSVAVAEAFPCRVVKHPQNMGKGAALRTGIQQARGHKVIFVDADNTYPVELIPAMAQLLDQYELVRGIRESGRENIPFVNRLGNKLFDSIIRALHAVEGGDLLSGMYGGHRDSLLSLWLESEGFDIEAEINVKAKAHGMTCATIPITYVERVGDKKLKVFQDGLQILYRVLQLAITYNPLLIFILPGLLLLVAGVIGAGWTLVNPIQWADLTLATHGTMVLGFIGTLGAQLVIFGLAVYAAGMAYGLRGRANDILDRVNHALLKRSFMLLSLFLIGVGGVGLIWLSLDWVISNRGPFENTAMLVLMSLALMIGFQLLSSIGFMSALKRLHAPIPPGIKE